MDRQRKNSLLITISHIGVQVSLALLSFIVPKVLLDIYGSTINGLINSITQMLTYVALVEAGIGNAAIAALYGPLSMNDYEKSNSILSIANVKYEKASIIYVIISIVLSLFYAFIVQGEVSYDFVVFMFVLISLSYAVDFIFIGKYKVLLVADHRYFVLNAARIVSTLLTLILSIILLWMGFSVLVVKFIAIMTRLVEVVIIVCYVKKKYEWVDFKSNLGKNKLEQQSNALIHQIANVVIYNTDLVVLTLLLPDSLKEASVYTVYILPFSVINNVLVALNNSVSPILGINYAKKENDKLKKMYENYESAFLIIMFLLYSCYAVLAVPFVMCYTNNVTDVNYYRPLVAILVAMAGITCQIHDPSITIITATGKYKETQNYVILEAIINIVLSVILVYFCGIVGVLIGTVIGHMVSSVLIINYANKRILNRGNKKTYKLVAINSIALIIILLLEFKSLLYLRGWGDFILAGIVCLVLNMCCLIIFNFKEVRKLIGILCVRKNKRNA